MNESSSPKQEDRIIGVRVEELGPFPSLDQLTIWKKA